MARVTVVKSFRGTSKTPDGNLTCGKVEDNVGDLIDHEPWEEAIGREERERAQMKKIADRWKEIVDDDEG